MRMLAALSAACLAVACSSEPSASDNQASLEARAAANAYAFDFVSIDGADMPLSQYEGDVLLVVNTASKCGFTPQYEGLQALWDTYQDDGLVVLGVPSDDFLGQELDSEAEVKEFCEVNFGINFPMTTINVVKRGKDGVHPFYEWVRAQTDEPKFPHWNFNKVLIARDGALLESFGQRVAPESEPLVGAIEAALQAEA